MTSKPSSVTKGSLEDLWYKFKFYLVELSHIQKRTRLKRYGFALILTALVVPVLNILPLVYFQSVNSQTISFLEFILVVTTSSWYGGLGPAILATILVSTINYFTILRVDFPQHPAIGDFFIIVIYMVVGFLIGIISEARYQAEFQKDQLIALVAHELRNPLSTIKGYADLLQKKFRKKREGKFSEYADEIGAQADKLLELVNDLLDVTRIEIGKFIYKDELFDFDSLVKKIVSNQQVIYSKRVITLSGSTRAILNADSYRVGQIVTNLLINAIKYSPLGNPIKVKIKNGKGRVILSVRDYGIGIPKMEKKAIFEDFYQSKKTKQARRNGLGLGLYIASQIVRHYHGKLKVKSKFGKGSVFNLELPKNY